MEFNESMVLGGGGKEYCQDGPATGIMRWVYLILGERCMTDLGSLMGSKADSRTGDP